MGGGGNDGGGVLGAGGGSRNVGHPSEFRLAARRLHSLYRLRSIRFKAPCTARPPACLPASTADVRRTVRYKLSSQSIGAQSSSYPGM